MANSSQAFENVLKEEIQNFSQYMLSDSPLFSGAKKGKITKDIILRYLSNINYLVEHTPIHLKNAISSSRKISNSALEEYYRDKFIEEQGHNLWAEKDVHSFGKNAIDFDLCSSMLNLTEYLNQITTKDPVAYIAYPLFAEYFTVLVGEPWLNDLETYCGIPKSQMSVVGNHVELDKHHVAHDFEHIEQIPLSDADRAKVLKSMKIAMSHIQNFAKEVVFGLDHHQEAQN